MALRRKLHSHRQSKKQNISHTAFHGYLQHYVEYLGIQNYSVRTIESYDSRVRHFALWCEERTLEPQQITKPILERYQKHLFHYRQKNGEPLSFRAQSIALQALKNFFKWMAQKNHMLYNPASEIQLPKIPRKLPREILTPEQISEIISQPDINTPDGIRDRTIMELFYGCGLRRSELTNLKLCDIHLPRSVLIVREGKGGQDRYLPLGETVQAWLEKYLNGTRDELIGPASEDELFLTDYGESYSRYNIGAMVKRYIAKSGIEVKGACHLFRHAMATHMLENGADIRFIQVMLGHRDLSTTQIYTQVSVEKLREIHRATHPSTRKSRAELET